MNPRRNTAIACLCVVAFVSAALLVWLGLTGGGSFLMGDVKLFSLSSPWKPLIAIALSVAGILWVLDVRGFRERSGKLRVVDVVFIVLMTFVFLQAMDNDLKLHGDSREYIIQTQSIVLQRSLRVDPEFIRAYWNRTEPFGEKLGQVRPPAKTLEETSQAGGGFGGLYPDRRREYRYYHFWAYSLAVAPLYAILHLFGGSLEYHAFRVMNAVFLLLPFLVAWRLGRRWMLLGVMALVLVSPLIAYTDWAHPELFCFALVILAFQLVEFPRARWWTPFLLGLAATQNLPIVLFFPAHAYWFSLCQPCDRETMTRGLVAYAAGVIVVFLSMLYFRYWFGVWNVISAIGLASLAYSSVSRALAFLFSPLSGAIWFFPAAFLFPLVCLRRKNALLVAGMWLPFSRPRGLLLRPQITMRDRSVRHDTWSGCLRH